MFKNSYQLNNVRRYTSILFYYSFVYFIKELVNYCLKQDYKSVCMIYLVSNYPFKYCVVKYVHCMVGSNNNNCRAFFT